MWTDFAQGDVALGQDFHKSIGNVACRDDQYYDDHVNKCSPCKEVCPWIPCPVCPNFVPNPEPVLEKKPERGTVDDAKTVFWIVLCIAILLIVLTVGAIIFWQRHRLVKLCKKRARPREVEAEMETREPLQDQNSALVV